MIPAFIDLRRLRLVVGVGMAVLLVPAARAAEGGGSPGAKAGAPAANAAPQGESMAERTLKRIAERQRELFADATKQGDKLDVSSFQTQVNLLVHEYEVLLRDNPKFAAAYAAYGYLLGKTDNRKEAMAMLLRANQLDSDIPLVKNQIGNLLAEEGKPVQAAPYFLAAIKLEPNEPLYHYQLGTLLTEAKDTFLRSNTPEWTRASIESAAHNAFKRAAELAPNRFEFAYRYAESFYDLDNPDWETALKVWSGLEEKAETPIERQTMRLHAANVLIKMSRRDHAKALLDSVDEPKLKVQKDRLLPLLAEAAKE